MTVQSTTARADYQGNGVTTLFPVPFYFLDNTHVKVLRTDSSTTPPTTALLVLGSDYTLTGAGVTTGGQVQTTIAPTGTQKLSVLRNVPFTQLIHYVPNDPFPAATHEQALDQLTMEVQQLSEAQTHSLQLPTYEPVPATLLPASSRASTVLGFDALGGVTYLPLPATVGAGDLRWDTFVANGTLPFAFTPNVTTALTLSRAPGTAANIEVLFDGVQQAPDQILSLAGAVLTFTSPIPLGTNKVYVRTGTTLSVTTPPNGSVSDASVAAGTRLYDRIYGVKIDARDAIYAGGVKADGVTDDTAAFQAAINAAGAGGWVDLPVGTLLLSATINALSNQTIEGVGGNSTVFQRNGNYGSTIRFTNALAATVRSIWFNHGTFYLAGNTTLNNLATMGAHIEMQRGQHALIEDCLLWRMPYGIQLDGTTLTTIRKCWIQGVFDPANVGCQEGTAGIFLNNSIAGCQIIKIEGCYVNGAKSAARNVTYTASDGTQTVSRAQNIGSIYGILVNSCEDLLVQGCFIGAQYSAGLFAKLSVGSVNLDWRIIGCFFDDGPSVGASINFSADAASVFVNGVTIVGNVFNGELQGRNAIKAFNDGAPGNSVLNNFVIANNTFLGHTACPIALYACANGTVTGNNVTAYNSVNASPGGDETFCAGIGLFGTAQYVHVYGNTVGGLINTGVPGGGFTYQGVVNNSVSKSTNTVHDNWFVGIGPFVNQTGLQAALPTLLTTPGSYTAAPGDQVVIAQATQTGAWTFGLPVNPPLGRKVTLKDGAGNAAAFAVQALGTIDGVVNPVYNTNFFSKTFFWNGSQWNVVG